LIFANGDLHDGPMVQETLAVAAGALVVAADGGARLARRLGLAVDVVIGDMDSLTEGELAALADAGAEVHRYPEEKNETDLELALYYAAHRDTGWIRVVGGMGDRLDQTLSNVYLLALPALKGRDVRLVAGRQEAWLLRAGEHTIEGEAGDTVSLIPLSGAAEGIRTENLYYPLNDERLEFGPARGISNVMQASRARVCLRDGMLLVVHTAGRA
jgi:thiamine pyrophosphokinase